ncbi:MAG: prepilin-type N-terminal cleavage/methylation domain-containing protein [Sporolactobacillus sp.]
MRNNQSGVTLIEVLAVSVLAAVLCAMMIGFYTFSERSAAQTTAESSVQQDALIVQRTIENAYFNRSTQPFRLTVTDSGQLQIINMDVSGNPETPSVVSGPGILYRAAGQSGTFSWPSATTFFTSSTASASVNSSQSSSSTTAVQITLLASSGAAAGYVYTLNIPLYDTWN